MTQQEKDKQETELLRQLEQLRATPVTPKPWEPKGGPWTALLGENQVEFFPPMQKFSPAGLEYYTKQAAQKALALGRFYMRLVALASELNPSGVAGGKYYVTFINGEAWEVGMNSYLDRDGYDIFETREAAQTAANIMNRDGWKLP